MLAEGQDISIASTSPAAGVELCVVEERLRKDHSWELLETEGCAVFIHLHGHITRVETEVDGVGARIDRLDSSNFSLLAKGRRYACEAEGGVVRHATLSIKETLFRDHLRADRAPDLRLALGAYDPFAHGCLARLAELSSDSDDISRLRSAGVLVALIERLIEGYSEPARRDGSVPVASRAERLRQYVHDNLGSDIRVQDLAAAADVSTAEVFDLFRREFGTTPAQFVIERRLQRSVALLSSTRLDITSIALAAGFSSHSHLATTFKKHLGYSPSVLRAERRMRRHSASDGVS